MKTHSYDGKYDSLLKYNNCYIRNDEIYILSLELKY